MNIYNNNILLEEEVRPIYQSGLPNHVMNLSLIIHTEEKDYYPDKVIEMDVISDYNANLSDQIIVSLFMGGADFKQLLYTERDNIQITTLVNFNGKVLETRYKAFLLNRQTDTIASKNSNMDMLEIRFQLINMLYGVLRLKTINGIPTNSSLDSVIRHFMDKELANVNIDGRQVKPLVDLTKLNNTRVYDNIILKDRIKLLDLPMFLQKEYGLYSGGLGTYIYKDTNGQDIIAVYPIYNASLQDEKKMKMILYLPNSSDADADVLNKTAIIYNNELQIIATTNITYKDMGETKHYDEGASFKTINSNQVMDRVYTKSNGVVTADKTKMIDSQALKETKDTLTMPSFDGTTDNLYVVRSKYIFNNSKLLQTQWNYSRPDYLIPGMNVEVVHYTNGVINREEGILISSSSSYTNDNKICRTLLNVLINGKVE